MHDATIAFEGALDLVGATPSVLPLETRGLVFEHRGQRLIDGIDLYLARGPRTVLMGPNGAGKSLLLRLLHGLLRPTSGSICWAGGSGAARRQAMVFQRPVLLRRSTAANVAYALRVQKVSAGERKSRLAAVLNAAGLGHLSHRPARVLSGGEQQRVALARALATQPEVLFLDEPTSNLDPASTQAIEELILQAHRDGTKIVLVTHDVGQARRMADEVVFVHHGKVTEHTPAPRFFESPLSEQARAYLEGRILL